MKRLTGLNTAYLLKAGHDLLLQEIREWKSDLEFFESEMKFFKKLLDMSFLRVTKKLETERLNMISWQMENSIYVKCISLLNLVKVHEENLGNLEEDILNKSDDAIIEEHNQLKKDVNMFIDEMKIFKKDLFAIVEAALHEEKMVDKGYREGSIAL